MNPQPTIEELQAQIKELDERYEGVNQTLGTWRTQRNTLYQQIERARESELLGKILPILKQFDWAHHHPLDNTFFARGITAIVPPALFNQFYDLVVGHSGWGNGFDIHLDGTDAIITLESDSDCSSVSLSYLLDDHRDLFLGFVRQHKLKVNVDKAREDANEKLNFLAQLETAHEG